MTRELYEEVMGKILDAAGVRYFSARELCIVGRTAKAGDRIVSLSAPRVRLFKNILETVRVADWLREQVGPLRVLSGYRDPAYNAAVGGEDGSLHMAFNALDIQSNAVSPERLAALAAKHPLARQMGIGLYPTFVHIDTRGLLGRGAPARWPSAEWKGLTVPRAA